MYKNSLWCKVIVGKYGLNPFSSSTFPSRLHNASPIIKGLLQLKSDPVSRMLIEANFVWTLGGGKLIYFWTDHWHPSGLMAQNFGTLYSLSIYKQSSMYQMKAKWLGTKGRWHFLWRRNLDQQESELADHLDVIILSLSLNNRSDHLQWGPFSNGFRSQECYKKLISYTGSQVPWKYIWKQKVPPKVKLFPYGNYCTDVFQQKSFCIRETSLKNQLVFVAENVH